MGSASQLDSSSDESFCGSRGGGSADPEGSGDDEVSHSRFSHIGSSVFEEADLATDDSGTGPAAETTSPEPEANAEARSGAEPPLYQERSLSQPLAAAPAVGSLSPAESAGAVTEDETLPFEDEDNDGAEGGGGGAGMGDGATDESAAPTSPSVVVMVSPSAVCPPTPALAEASAPELIQLVRRREVRAPAGVREGGKAAPFLVQHIKANGCARAFVLHDVPRTVRRACDLCVVVVVVVVVGCHGGRWRWRS